MKTLVQYLLVLSLTLVILFKMEKVSGSIKQVVIIAAKQ